MSIGMGIWLSIFTAILWGIYAVPLKITGARGHHPLSFNVGAAVGFTLLGWIVTLVVAPSSIGVTASTYGGLLWAPMAVGFLLMVGLAFGFTAIGNIGMARAIGVWNMCCIGGALIAILFFGEMHSSPGWALATLIIGGVIIVAGGITVGWSSIIQARAAAAEGGAVSDTTGNATKGFTQAIIAAIFFSVFLVPVIAAPKFSAGFPYAWIAWGGIGAIIGAVISGYIFMGSKFNQTLKVPFSFWCGAALGGAIWTAGYMMLTPAINALGLAVAYPIALSNTIVSALVGVFVFKELKGAPRAAHYYTWFGIIIVMIGVVLVSYARTVPPIH
jgi:glucose uptake protein GlcU